MSALAKSVAWSPVSPLWSEPTTAIAPTQNSKLAETNPCANALPPPCAPPLPANAACARSPRRFSARSRSIQAPSAPPATIESTAMSTFSPESEPLTPMYSTTSPTPPMIASEMRAGSPFFSNSPTPPPTRMAAAFTMVPNMAIVPACPYCPSGFPWLFAPPVPRKKRRGARLPAGPPAPRFRPSVRAAARQTRFTPSVTGSPLIDQSFT